MKMNDDEINDVTEEALNDFWSRVAKRFPKATSGDLSPERTFALKQAATEAVREWFNNNCPDIK